MLRTRFLLAPTTTAAAAGIKKSVRRRIKTNSAAFAVFSLSSYSFSSSSSSSFSQNNSHLHINTATTNSLIFPFSSLSSSSSSYLFPKQLTPRRFCSSTTATTTTTNNNNTKFAHLVDRCLFRLSYSSSSSSSSTSSNFIPLRELSLSLPEDASEEFFENFSGGGLKEFLLTDEFLKDRCQVKRNEQDGSWVVRHHLLMNDNSSESLYSFYSSIAALGNDAIRFHLASLSSSSSSSSSSVSISLQDLDRMLSSEQREVISKSFGGNFLHALLQTQNQIPISFWRVVVHHNNESEICLDEENLQEEQDWNEKLRIRQKLQEEAMMMMKKGINNNNNNKHEGKQQGEDGLNGNSSSYSDIPPPAPPPTPGSSSCYSAQIEDPNPTSIPPAPEVSEILRARDNEQLRLQNQQDLAQQQNQQQSQSKNDRLLQFLNAGTKASAASSCISTEDMLSFIPSFFVPLQTVLEQLEPLGYTREHFEEYLSHMMSSVQVISRTKEATFVRILACGPSIDMLQVLETNERFRRFEPLPALSRPFLKVLSRPGQWMTLQNLLDLAGKEAEEALPFQGPDALLFFSQLQHMFVFSLERGGMVSRRKIQSTSASSTSAAGAGGGGGGGDQYQNFASASSSSASGATSSNFSLFASTTPCPIFYNQLLRLLQNVPQQSAQSIQASMHPQALEQMQRCFPSWEAFALAHCEKFYFHPGRQEMMLNSLFKSEQRKQLSLDEQLHDASMVHGKGSKQVKALRRKIARERNPDNPLLDPERLAHAVAEFLPAPASQVLGNSNSPRGPRGHYSEHIPVRALMFSLPDEIRDLLPAGGLMKLLKRYPNVFSTFDFMKPDSRHVMHAGLPLPNGALRDDFSRDEVVALVVQDLQRREGKARVADLITRLPQSVREVIKKPTDLVAILKEFADCFVFVSSGDIYNVKLVRVPNLTFEEGSSSSSSSSSSNSSVASALED